MATQSEHTCISHAFLLDERLSLRAKGLYALMLSRPSLTITEASLVGPDGETSIRRAAHELLALGRLTRRPGYRDSKGNMHGARYVAVEE